MSAEEIVRDVRARGDEAVREWALRLDGAEPAPAVATDGACRGGARARRGGAALARGAAAART